MVQEVSGQEEFHRLTGQKGKLVVVDFTATWCGPCKMVAPQYEQLASQHPDVLFLKVVEDYNKELVVELSIRAFPTFRFYLDGKQVDETRGANIQEVARKVELHKKNVRYAFEGEGVSLGGSGEGGDSALSAEDARAKRLARFGKEVSVGTGQGPDPEAARRNAKILAQAVAGDVPDAPTSISVTAAAAAGGKTRPRRAADPSLVSELVEMGFAEVRAKKSLMFGAGSDLESAVNWLMEHQDDEAIDDPIPELEGKAAGVPEAMDVDDEGASAVEAAARALTPEEKAAKVAKMKELVAVRRAAREEEEKVDHVKREKARRTMGKEAVKTKEEMQAIARKHEIARMKKEKEDFERERARLKAEIARDKAERKARGGRLSTKLGVDGYNPAAPQGTYGAADAPQEGGEVAEPAAPVQEEPSEEKMAKAVDRLARQTVAGLGGIAMKTCLAYIKNALEKPQEEKFRSINVENNAYKNRVSCCIGGTALLRAVGFVKEEGRLYMSLEARNEDLLRTAKQALEKALAAYTPVTAG